MNASFESTDFVYPTGSVTINGGAGDAVTVSTNITIPGDLTITADTVNLPNDIALGTNDLTVNVAVGGTSGGVISGDGTVTKGGAGTLVVSGNNTYTGQTTVADGVLQMGHNNALGAIGGGTVVSSGGALDFAGFDPNSWRELYDQRKRNGRGPTVGVRFSARRMARLCRVRPRLFWDQMPKSGEEPVGLTVGQRSMAAGLTSRKWEERIGGTGQATPATSER